MILKVSSNPVILVILWNTHCQVHKEQNKVKQCTGIYQRQIVPENKHNNIKMIGLVNDKAMQQMSSTLN